MFRIILMMLGFLSLFLSFLGIFLPILPTTPFVILAAACFAKSSTKVHQWIHRNKYFGTTVKSWEETRTMSLKAKRISISMLNLSILMSIIFAGRHNIYILAILVLTAIGVTGFILHIPTAEEKKMGENTETDVE